MTFKARPRSRSSSRVAEIAHVGEAAGIERLLERAVTGDQVQIPAAVRGDAAPGLQMAGPTPPLLGATFSTASA